MEIISIVTDCIATILIVVSLVVSSRALKRSASNVAYGRWNDIYLAIEKAPKSLEFFSDSIEGLDRDELLVFLRIIDLYADRDESGLGPEGTLLETILRTDKGRKYWLGSRDIFFSDQQWKKRVDALLTQ